MPVKTTRSFAALWVPCLTLALASFAPAEISITNAGFETAVADETTPAGWSYATAGGTGRGSLLGASIGQAVPEGGASAHLYTASVSSVSGSFFQQVAAAFEANTTYTLNVAVGDMKKAAAPAQWPFPNTVTIGIYHSTDTDAGLLTSPLVQTLVTSPPADGQFGYYTTTFTTGAVAPSGPVVIGMSMTGSNISVAMFDDVTLTTTTLPDYTIWTNSQGPGFSDSHPASDPDGDGLSNQQEYAFGLNPTLASSSNPIVVPLNKSTGSFSYTRRIMDLPVLTYAIETSTDLQIWTTLENPAETVTNTNGDGTVVTVRVTLPPALLDVPQVFVRVRTAPPPSNNPGFEGVFTEAGARGSISTGWAHHAQSGDGTVTYAKDSTTFHSGASSQKVTLVTAGTVGTRLSHWGAPGGWDYLLGGHTYMASVWIKASVPGIITFRNSCFGNNSVAVNTDWQQVHISGKIPGISGASICTETWIGLTSPMTIWVDDFGLYDVTPGENLLANGGFEGPYGPVPTGIGSGATASGWRPNAASGTNLVYGQATGRTGLCQTIRYTSGGWGAQLVQTEEPIYHGLSDDRLYEFTGWLKASSSATVTVGLECWGGSGIWKTVSVGTDWTPFRFTTQVRSAGVSYVPTIQVPSGGATISVDDFTVADVTPPLPQAPVSREFFGMHFSYDQGTPALPWPVNPVGLYRIWDANVQWFQLQPSAAYYNFNPGQGTDSTVWNQAALERLDKIVNHSITHGAVPIMTLGMTPNWAAEYTNPDIDYGSSYVKDIQYWKDYVTVLGNRYKDKIHYWEVWNEPFYSWTTKGGLPYRQGFFIGTPAQLVTLHQTARDILKAIDPSNQIIGPAQTAAALEQFLNAGGDPYCDIHNDHSYLTTTQTPENILSDIGGLRRILAARNIHKPVWITEQGWYQKDYQYPDDTAVAYVGRTYLLNWAYGQEGRFGWYRWENNAIYGQAIHLTTPEQNNTLTAAGTAHATVRDWMLGAVMTGLTRSADDTWLITLTRPTNPAYRGYILWTRSETGTNYPIPSAWGISRKRELNGTTTPSSPTSVPVGIKPVLYENTTP